MILIMPLLRALTAVNSLLLSIGKSIAWIAIGLMVIVILLQVVFRYVLNNALPWPDEAARFLMLWMTGLIAPTAYRHGGFVAIEMFRHALPKFAAHALSLFLLGLTMMVLVVAIQFGIKHVNSGWLFASSTLKLPLHLFGLGIVPIKLAWMYMSLAVGFGLLALVNVELILRELISLAGREDELPDNGRIIEISAD